MQGLFVPQFTAFDKDHNVDFVATREHGEWLLANGVSGLVPFGTFGEGSSLSFGERVKVTEDLASITNGKALIPCVISNSLGDIWEYLEFVKDIPVAAVMVIPPSYYRPIDNQSLIDFYKAVVERSPHKIIAYNIPSCSLKIDSEVAANVPIWGVKDSSGDYNSATDFLSHGIKVLLGSDSLLVKGMAAGASGGICGIANFFPVQMSKIYELSTLKKFDEAEAILSKIIHAIDAVVKPAYSTVEAIGCLKNAAANFIPTAFGKMRLPSPTLQSPDSELSEMIERAKLVYQS